MVDNSRVDSDGVPIPSDGENGGKKLAVGELLSLRLAISIRCLLITAIQYLVACMNESC